MYHEAVALAREIDPRWTYRSAELMTLYAKAKAFEAGEVVEFNGKKYPPLYTPKNDTLINLFCITDDEQRHLKTIISADIARERHAERERARRQAAGAMERATYEQQRAQQAQEKAQQAREMMARGMSVREIAQALCVTVRTVYYWTK
jgi:hypothetical protein